MSSHHPYYRKVQPTKRAESNFWTDHIDFSKAHLAAFDEVEAVATANAQFDDRVAAVVRAYAHSGLPFNFWSSEGNLFAEDLLNQDDNGVLTPTAKCLAFLAYPDFFGTRQRERLVASDAILASQPGWCGTFGPGDHNAYDFVVGNKSEGNYDIAQMHLLPMAYCYYDEIPKAREYLITSLLARGLIHGPSNDDTYTSGFFRETWSRAGKVLGKSIGETENHILMIMATRYLTNQLLYQRDPQLQFDNRRNSLGEVTAEYFATHPTPLVTVSPVAPHKDPTPGSCAFLLLDLLQRILRDDFSEYNAKGYQQETRWALVNLYNYAYDHEIRLGARMVLDYLSAQFVVSTNDLRRLVPFRRRNEFPKNARDEQGFMTTAILDWQNGADPMGPAFAILAGNVRAYETEHSIRQHPEEPWSWGIRTDGDGGDHLVDALSDYRIPPSIHDLFVNDLHRRFHQRLHRTIRDDEADVGGHRNCDNMEIFASSPSYLITAGGTAAIHAISPYYLGVLMPDQDQQRGVAVTTTFMPTTHHSGAATAEEAIESVNAKGLIQFSCFTQLTNGHAFGDWYGAWNYGVAPDFACGHQIDLPAWVNRLKGTPSYVSDGNFIFINRGNPIYTSHHRPGFYLAIYRENRDIFLDGPGGGFAFLEAFDTWLHPEVMTFLDFQKSVKDRTTTLSLRNNVETHYQTWNGNEFDFVIWNDASRHGALVGAEVMNLKYSDLDRNDPHDAFGNAGNITDKFLNGTVMNNPGDAVVEITNHYLGTTLTLDMHDLLRPRRISENGEIEQAGFDNEVWLDFDWKGANMGDACQPFATIAGATNAVADGGVIKIIPGQTRERTTIGSGGKRMKLVAPIGDVTIGVR